MQDFDESFDSCITATLILYFSNTIPSSVSLLPIPLTLSVLSSLISSADGAGVEDGGVYCWVFEAEQGLQAQSLFIRYCAAFKSPEHFTCTHPEHLVQRYPAIRRSRSCV